ncbi:MAG TPA: CoA transferase [Dehalococcoidia bacterium]|nr:CoA transferase [Dehalococcoidia bacterium]
MTRPLDGVVVVEAGEGITAAYCTQIMAVLGAEVVKVEPPGGDHTRRLGPFPNDLPDPERSGLFLHLNHNKRSITLDLDTATGQDLFRSIVRGVGIVVEDFAPGHLDERGLGYEALSQDHESLVMTSVTPFGQSGPYRDYRATELTLFALGGLANLVGSISREPLKFGGSPALHAAGVSAFSATLMALYLAEEAGVGQHVDVSVMEGLAASHFQDLAEYDYHGLVRRRGELRTPIPCQDGFVSFAYQAQQYADFRRLILGDGAPEEDIDAATIEQRRREGELDTEILVWSYDKTKEQAYRLAQEAHVPAAYLADMSDVVASPQYAAREYFVEIDHPKAGALRYPGLPAKLTDVDWEYASAPLLGQHTNEILKQFTDLTDDEIAEVTAAGVL